jgi:hypothetical protein
MAKPTQRQTCKRCGKHRSEVGQMSWTGQCQACGEKRLWDNALAISRHDGPEFQRYRRAMVAAFGGVLLDDSPAGD